MEDKMFVAYPEGKKQKESSWVKMIEDYCSDNDIMPSALLDAHRSLNKPATGRKQGNETISERKAKEREEAPAGETYFQKLQRLKLGENENREK